MERHFGQISAKFRSAREACPIQSVNITWLELSQWYMSFLRVYWFLFKIGL